MKKLLAVLMIAAIALSLCACGGSAKMTMGTGSATGTYYGFGGVLGMFLGVPIFACLQVLVRWLLNTRLEKRHMPLQAWEYVRRDRQDDPPPTHENKNKQ